MGEIADMMLDGTLCAQCGGYLPGDAPGHPRCCKDCAKDARTPRPDDRVPCPTCGKKLKFIGLNDHRRDAHGRGRRPTT